MLFLSSVLTVIAPQRHSPSIPISSISTDFCLILAHNVRAYRTQITFATQPNQIGSSGAARLLGVAVIVRVEFQGHQVLIVELSSSRKGLLFGAVDAEAE